MGIGVFGFKESLKSVFKEINLLKFHLVAY